MIKIKVEQVQ